MAVQYVGACASPVTTNGSNPTALTPNAATKVGDLLLFIHFSGATGGNETCALTGFTAIANSVDATYRLLYVAYRFRQSGDTTYTATVTNHTSNATTGEAITENLYTFSGVDRVLYGDVGVVATAATSTTAWGTYAPPTNSTVPPGGMVVLAIGRSANQANNPSASGDSLTWTAGVRVTTTLGADACHGMIRGYNGTAANQTLTNKSPTATASTTAVSKGCSIILLPEPRRIITN